MQQEQALQLSSPQRRNSALVEGQAYTWRNELGSTMTFTLSNMQLSGTYQSAVGADGPVSGPLLGWTDGGVIAFAVNWPNSAITTWTGHLMIGDDGLIIETLWQMGTALENPTKPDDLWTSILAGSDRFVRAGD